MEKLIHMAWSVQKIMLKRVKTSLLIGLPDPLLIIEVSPQLSLRHVRQRQAVLGEVRAGHHHAQHVQRLPRAGHREVSRLAAAQGIDGALADEAWGGNMLKQQSPNLWSLLAQKCSRSKM